MTKDQPIIAFSIMIATSSTSPSSVQQGTAILALGSSNRLTTLVKLRTFLSLAAGSSAPPTASPIILWDTLTTVVQICAKLLEDNVLSDDDSSHSAERVVADRSRTQHLETTVSGTAERLSMVEILLKKVFDDLSDKQRIWETERNRIAKQFENVNQKFDNLVRGVEKHAEFNHEVQQRVSEALSQHASDISRLKVQLDDINVKKKTAHVDPSPVAPQLGIIARDWKAQGVEVANVAIGSKAEVAGVATHDIIVGVDNEPCLNLSDFRRLIQKSFKSISNGEAQMLIHLVRKQEIFCVSVPLC